MDFRHSDRALDWHARVRRFLDEQVIPREADYFAQVRENPNRQPPVMEAMKAAAREAGLWNMFLPGGHDGENGGAGLTNLEYAPLAEMMGRHLWTAEVFNCNAPDTGNMEVLHMYGNAAQQDRWLKPLMAGEIRSAFLMTEPEVASSDATNIRTRIERDGDHYVLNGSKAFISGAGTSDVYVVMARTGADGPKGISTFVVDKDAPGLSFGAQEKKMGWNSQPTAIVQFDDCRVPAANLLGKEGDGFRYAMMGLDGGRLNIAACSIGGARLALETAQDYVTTRKQFGKPLADFQNTQFKLADMATQLEAARLLVLRGAWALDTKHPEATKWCAMAKRFATDACFQIADEALQLHGGYGYLKDYPLERIVRDLRVHRILEGTNEIMRVITAREMLRQ